MYLFCPNRGLGLNVFVGPRQWLDLMYLFVRAGAGLNVFGWSEQGLDLCICFVRAGGCT